MAKKLEEMSEKEKGEYLIGLIKKIDMAEVWRSHGESVGEQLEKNRIARARSWVQSKDKIYCSFIYQPAYQSA